MVNSVTTQTNSQIDPRLTESSSASSAQSKEIGKDAFLKLLVAQLKNQDPLEPKDQGAFAVDLAQFTQVEQLQEISKKIGGNSSGAGLASYLGQEVVLNSDKVTVSGGDAGSLSIDLPVDVSSLNVELLDEAGKVQDTKTFSDLKSGKQSVALNDINASTGDYSYRVTALSRTGASLNISAKVSGIVSGFIPGAETLLVGNKEVKMTDISEVRLGKQ